MDIRDRNREREREIADIIREYSKGDVDRSWLLSKNRDMESALPIFRALKINPWDALARLNRKACKRRMKR